MGVSRLQRSEVVLGGYGRAIITPVHPGRKEIVVTVPWERMRITPEEAYALGDSLIEHAKECGYDEDTGETREVV